MNERRRPCQILLRYRPPRIATSLLLAGGTLQLSLSQEWTTVGELPLAGLLLAGVGLVVMLRAWWLFRLHATPICPTSKATSLITTDIYRLTRNPMYLGIVLMLLGIAVASGSVFLYAATLFYFLAIDHVFCTYEEQQLEQKFGAQFTDYTQQVRRWL